MKEKYFQEIYEQIDVPKEDVQNSIRNGIKRAEFSSKKKKRSLRGIAVAAILLVTTITMLSFSFPSFAEKLPIIGTIFELFQDDEKRYIFDEYESHSTYLNMTEESNGVSITLTEAVYDGENITIAFKMESEHDLGEEPFIEWDTPQTISTAMFSGSQLIKKIDENKYAGILMFNFEKGHRPDTFDFTWEAYKIGTFDKEIDQTQLINTIEGNWLFDLTLDNIGSQSQEFDNLLSTGDGMEIELKNITRTPISTSFYTKEKVSKNLKEWEEENWSAVIFDYELKDNLGNEYTVVTNGSYGNHQYVMNGRFMTTNIAEEAKSIIITPIATPWKQVDEPGRKYGTGIAPAKEPFKLNPIEVQLD
ncbi:DUF4179 domain-containing protein [Paucisalibacillus sp. EB02]|uniref:DUF4179 domain-containing protein n=1 Tax=Paucisalibacillus sp. EB02 TaxID=1347087 RepID=UPI0004B607C8|nr:DUF4179 domain-containing protein [Paucisalibacillus sp. EB02]